MKKIISSLLCICLLCLVATLSVNAEENSALSKNEVNSVQPRSIMHLSHTAADDKLPISVTFVYGYQESTNQIISIDTAYVSYYNPAVIEECYVQKDNGYGWYSNYEGFYAIVSYKYRGANTYNVCTVDWFF